MATSFEYKSKRDTTIPVFLDDGESDQVRIPIKSGINYVGDGKDQISPELFKKLKKNKRFLDFQETGIIQFPEKSESKPESDQTATQIAENQKNLDALLVNIEEKVTEETALINQIKELEKHRDTLAGDVELFDKQQEDLKVDIETLTNQKADLQSDVEGLESKKSGLEKDIEKLEAKKPTKKSSK